MDIVVCEHFHSIQGEGISSGLPAIFIRLAGCNLQCGGWGSQHSKKPIEASGATWFCDTTELWRNGSPIEVYEFASELHNKYKDYLGKSMVVITGGEPMLQQKQLSALLDCLRLLDVRWLNRIEVETNGTIKPSQSNFYIHVSQWNISPKLLNSGMEHNKRFNKEALQWFIDRQIKYQFKFVVSNEKDWREIETSFQFIPRESIVLMPAAETRQQLIESMPFVWDLCAKHGVRFSSRLHLTSFDKKTGV